MRRAALNGAAFCFPFKEVPTMTGEQKQRIHALRQRGLDYGEIADVIGVAKNTVKTYCWRNNLSTSNASEETGIKENNDLCKHCGKKLDTSATKPRKFCSDSCRFTWWRQNRDQLKQKAVYPKVCARCGAAFESYGNASRKYCSHACYIAHRFPCERTVAAT